MRWCLSLELFSMWRLCNMKNYRFKIHQLRIGYFMPASIQVPSTSDIYRPRICNESSSITQYGLFSYHTPCVDYVSVIHNIYYIGTSIVQSMPVVHQSNPYKIVTPYRQCSGSFALTYGVTLYDFSAYLRLGYLNFFHQAIPSPTWPFRYASNFLNMIF